MFSDNFFFQTDSKTQPPRGSVSWSSVPRAGTGTLTRAQLEQCDNYNDTARHIVDHGITSYCRAEISAEEPQLLSAMKVVSA